MDRIFLLMAISLLILLLSQVEGRVKKEYGDKVQAKRQTYEAENEETTSSAHQQTPLSSSEHVENEFYVQFTFSDAEEYKTFIQLSKLTGFYSKLTSNEMCASYAQQPPSDVHRWQVDSTISSQWSTLLSRLQQTSDQPTNSSESTDQQIISTSAASIPQSSPVLRPLSWNQFLHSPSFVARPVDDSLAPSTGQESTNQLPPLTAVPDSVSHQFTAPSSSSQSTDSHHITSMENEINFQSSATVEASTLILEPSAPHSSLNQMIYAPSAGTVPAHLQPEFVAVEVAVPQELQTPPHEHGTQLSDLQTHTQPSYLLIHTCGRRYICPKGSTGLCRPGEVLTYHTRPRAELSCPGEPSLWAMGCYPTQISADEQNSLLVGHCEKKVEAQNYNAYGSYTCSNPNYVMVDGSNACYRAFSRGPCAPGKWLEPNQLNTQLASCQISPCPHLADGRHIYWDEYGAPGCYRSNTRGPCRRGMTFVIEDLKTGQARCIRSGQYYQYNANGGRYPVSKSDYVAKPSKSAYMAYYNRKPVTTYPKVYGRKTRRPSYSSKHRRPRPTRYHKGFY